MSASATFAEFFRKMPHPAGRRRRCRAAFDQPLGRARRHQLLDQEIHLPRRLYPGPVGSGAADRGAGLYVTDIEILRLHYAETLREWGNRFADHRDRAKAIYDERFCRMWEFYLAASECAFRYSAA